MRKFASIIMLIILLFNMAGYRAWFHYAEMRSDAAMEARLDKSQYEETELIAITIPLDNPYQLEQSSFVRVDGEISFRGKTLKYVKRKVADGKLILLCISDEHKSVLKKAKAAFGNSLNDLSGNSKSPSKNNLQKNFSSNDYISQMNDVSVNGCSHTMTENHPFPTADPAEVCIASPGKPPKRLNIV